MQTIKAIETAYSGYKFRSRLEARWAVFFDAIGVKWEYEPEGFDLGDAGWYLPDFRVWTPQENPIWYEIKPWNVLHDKKLQAFARGLEADHYLANDANAPGWRAALLSGDPIDVIGEKATRVCPRCGLIDSRIRTGLTAGSSECDTYCFPCDIETPSHGNPETGLLGLVSTSWKGRLEVERLSDYMTFMGRIFEAASIARRARFEYGAQLPMPDSSDVISLVMKHADGMR